ncbi:MAG: cyclic nucleotide-binding domain-containing protein [Candidatus Latescibacteria bacterium]|nr:cyclic nucleotide-binding domain-containing protein [Candidatus Latescibacterota bacterium]
MDRSRMTKVVERIPIFKGLSPHRLQKVLDICSESRFGAGQVVCEAGDESSEFYVILSGSLSVRTTAGLELASVGQMGVVGEMGVLTNRPRSASILAAKNTIALRVGKADLYQLMDSDGEIGLHIYREFAHLLCDRLRTNNAHLEQFYFIVEDLTANPPE